MGLVWSIMLATDSGIRNTPPIYVREPHTMGSRGLHTWLQVILPTALPFIVSGMKRAWAFAWRSLMAAEIYITITTGVGLREAIALGRILSPDVMPRKVLLIGIEGISFETIGARMTPEVAAAIEAGAQEVCRQLALLLAE